jgi:hypothetical protein
LRDVRPRADRRGRARDWRSRREVRARRHLLPGAATLAQESSSGTPTDRQVRIQVLVDRS